jgi:hypothetical protein
MPLMRRSAFGGNEANTLEDGQEAGNAIDAHDVNAQGDITVVLHELPG